MKTSVWLLAMMAFILLAGGNVLAQGDNTFYFVAYFSNANTAGAPDGTLRLINDGDVSTSEVAGVPNGTLYASIYVFDDSQQMEECCNCQVTADGLLSESVNNNLVSNTLTRVEETSRGVLKIISGAGPDPTNNLIKHGLRGFMTHIQATPNLPNSPYSVTETQLADSNLSLSERQDLEITCGFVEYLGSGYGVCSCTPEDQDF
jgi:hypothetical protein